MTGSKTALADQAKAGAEDAGAGPLPGPDAAIEDGEGAPADAPGAEDERAGAGGAVRVGGRDSEGAADPAARTTSRCGPELASPGGIDAQACVLTRGGLTWARTYYRNAIGSKLTAVLTLMAPGGRTVRINCDVDAGDEQRTCETPREPSRGAASAYWTVVEFAAQDGTGEGPLLLRLSSNS